MSVKLINPSIYPFDLYKQGQYTDPVLTNAFNFLIPVVPGSNNDPEVSQSLQIQLQTIGTPMQYTIAEVAVKMGRGKFNYAGAGSWRQKLDVSFFETATGFVTNTFQNWRNMIFNYQTNLNGAKKDYATTAVLYVIGVDNQLAMQCILNNVWISSFEVANTGFSQDSSKNEPMQVKGSFTFDYLDSPILLNQGSQNA